MEMSNSEMAKQVALATIAFEEQKMGRAPKSVTAAMSGETLVVTLHGALSPAERALARSPEGAAQVQELHRELFASALDALRKEIKRITGVDVREATVEVDTTTGTVVKAFTNGTVVQVFLLADSVAAGTWSGSGLGVQAMNTPGARRTL